MNNSYFIRQNTGWAIPQVHSTFNYLQVIYLQTMNVFAKSNPMLIHPFFQSTSYNTATRVFQFLQWIFLSSGTRRIKGAEINLLLRVSDACQAIFLERAFSFSIWNNNKVHSKDCCRIRLEGSVDLFRTSDRWNIQYWNIQH